MKTKICLFGIFAFVTLAIAEPHTWILKTGETVTGDYVSSGTTTLVVKTGGTNCFLKISSLSIKDQAYTFKMQVAQRQARLDAEAKQMGNAGWIEVTAQSLENFPEKTKDKTGWMDVEFDELGSSYDLGDFYAESYLGFGVRDKNGNYFGKCVVEKNVLVDPNAVPLVHIPNPAIDQISQVKRGDKIRLIGRREDLYLGVSNEGWRFFIYKVEIIETAAEKDFIEQQDSTTP